MTIKDKTIEELAAYCRGLLIYNSTRQLDAVECRHLYNNDDIADSYSYLYEKASVLSSEGLAELNPNNTMKRIPVVRNKIRRLTADIKPITMTIYRTDAELHDEKIDAKLEEIFMQERARIENRKRALEVQQQALQMQQQLVEQQSAAMAQQGQQGQQDPNNPQAQAQVDPQIQQQLAQIQSVLKGAEEFLFGRITHEQNELEKINTYFDNSFKSESEKIIHSCMNYAIQTKNLDRVKLKGFEESLVTDQEIYKVHWDGKSDDPCFELITPEFLSYPENTNCEFIHELPFCQYTRFMTAESVIDNYCFELDEEMVKSIIGNHASHHNDFELVHVDAQGYRMSGGSTQNYYRTNESIADLQVDEVFFKQEERLYIVYSKENGIRGEVPKTVSKEVYKKEKAKGKHCDIRYMMRLCEAVFINGTLLYAKECDTQKRDEYNFSSVRLPYIGYCRHKLNPTYSIIRETKTLQEMYDICSWKEQYFVINAKANVMVLDITQMPKAFDTKQWNYFASMGNLFINPNANGNGTPSKFNQWQEIQRGVSSSVQQLQAIKAQTLQTIGMITGVSDVMDAQIAPTQLATNTEEKVTQSYLSTEYYHLKHEVLWNEAMTEYANYCKLSYANGKRATYVIGDIGQQLLKIEKGSLYGQFKIYLKSTAKAAMLMRTMRQMIAPKMQQGQISSSAYALIMQTDDIRKMQDILVQAEKLEQKNKESITQQQQQGEQQLSAQQHQQQMEIEQFTAQTQMQIHQISEQGRQALAAAEIEFKREALQMKHKELQIKERIETETIAAEKEMSEGNNAMRKYAVDEDAKTEREYLAVKAKETESYITLQELEMELKQLEIKNSFQKDKIDVRSMTAKNRIKD